MLRSAVSATSTNAKSEWMYCTDFDLDPCAGVDENGLPVDKHNDEMGATVPSSGNPDLSADDLAVISWLLQNPAKLDGVVSGNGSEDARSARQTLVWCVSDYDNPLMADFKSLCDRNIGDDERARIVEIMNVTQTLDLVRKTPATGTLKAGETAVFTLNTNMYRKPINVQSSAGTELTRLWRQRQGNVECKPIDGRRPRRRTDCRGSMPHRCGRR